MGTDVETSVANGDGELHDVTGGVGRRCSAPPTAPGVNPMITIMALAERTSRRIIGQSVTMNGAEI